jgi:hypothetical protein
MFRRLLYSSEYVRDLARALQQARDDLDMMHARHMSVLDKLCRELDAVRSDFNALRAVVLARNSAYDQLVELHRERAIGLAKAAERDPATALQ